MVSVMLYPCMFCVALSMDLFVLCVVCLTVFVNCLVISFRNLRIGSQVFALLILFLCVILHNMSFVRACNCYASFPLVCCACLPSV